MMALEIGVEPGLHGQERIAGQRRLTARQLTQSRPQDQGEEGCYRRGQQCGFRCRQIQML